MRPEGLYWIKYDTDEWTVGEYYNGRWDVIGEDVRYTDEDLNEIGEPVIRFTPQKEWTGILPTVIEDKPEREAIGMDTLLTGKMEVYDPVECGGLWGAVNMLAGETVRYALNKGWYAVRYKDEPETEFLKPEPKQKWFDVPVFILDGIYTVADGKGKLYPVTSIEGHKAFIGYVWGDRVYDYWFKWHNEHGLCVREWKEGGTHVVCDAVRFKFEEGEG